MRNPALQKSNKLWHEKNPACYWKGWEWNKSDQANSIRLTEMILMARTLTFILRLESSLPPEKVGPCLGTIIPGDTILLKHNWNTIQKRLKLLNYMNSLPTLLTRLLCNTTLITVVVLFANKNMATTKEKNVKIAQTVKWSSHLIPFRGKKVSGDMRVTPSIQNKNLVWVSKTKTFCFQRTPVHKKYNLLLSPNYLGSQEKCFLFWNHNKCCLFLLIVSLPS